MPYTIELRDVRKHFGSVIALNGVSISVNAGEVLCLLGDNGAGKSTLIKTLAGVHKPTSGSILLEGEQVVFNSPRDALDRGIGTVYQDLALVHLMSVTRNFFMGREITKGWGPFKQFDWQKCNRIVKQKMLDMGIDIRDPSQPVGTMSGGERQCVAIARAIDSGAKVLILDEPTAALGVRQSATVLQLVVRARARGLAVILITHNVHHAYPIANKFVLLNRGQSMGQFDKQQVSREDILNMMAGGVEMEKMQAELEASIRQADAAYNTPPIERQ